MSTGNRIVTGQQVIRAIGEHALGLPCPDCPADPGQRCPSPRRGREICRARWLAAAAELSERGRKPNASEVP